MLKTFVLVALAAIAAAAFLAVPAEASHCASSIKESSKYCCSMGCDSPFNPNGNTCAADGSSTTEADIKVLADADSCLGTCSYDPSITLPYCVNAGACPQTGCGEGFAVIAAPTAAPTPAPTPSFEWQQESGCCREKVGKSMYNHHATVSDVQVFSQSTGYEADLNCTATCASDTTCTAIELTAKKGTARCEFHTSAINAATRGSKSCKKAQCKYKTAYMAPTAAPVSGPTPMVSPTSAPTAVPTPAPAWTEKKGCCRQVDGKIKYSHHDTATTTIISATLFSAAAVECKAQCNADANCTAAEVRQQRKKISTVFKCELHSDTINSSTRGSKSCKKATCSIKN